jgi:hypothetical protein
MSEKFELIDSDPVKGTLNFQFNFKDVWFCFELTREEAEKIGLDLIRWSTKEDE